MRFQTFEDVQHFLDNLNQHHIDLSLERMKQGLVALNLEKISCKVVQVLGTNGKGSTATFLSSLAQAHGLKVGLYTSPHFVTPRERVRINGKMVSPNIWCKNIEEVLSKICSVTYFELITLFALYTFITSGVDFIVLEAGLGGKYDATTAVPVDLVCYTPITFDHEKFLGNTITEIALEKAQAIRRSKPMLTGPQEYSVFDILLNTAKEKNASFYFIDDLLLPCDVSLFNYDFNCIEKEDTGYIDKPKLGLNGKYQVMNAKLALGAWSILSQENNWNTEVFSIYYGLEHAHIAGRFQYIELDSAQKKLNIILDGAHNPSALEILALEFQLLDINPCAVIFSCFVDKNVIEMAKIIENIASNAPIIVPTIQGSDRAMDSQQFINFFKVDIIPVQRLSLALTYINKESIQSTKQQPIVIVGSLYLLGEFFTLYPHTLVL